MSVTETAPRPIPEPVDMISRQQWEVAKSEEYTQGWMKDSVHESNDDYDFLAVNPQRTIDYKRPDRDVWPANHMFSKMSEQDLESLSHVDVLRGSEAGRLLLKGLIDMSDAKSVGQAGEALLRLENERIKDSLDSAVNVYDNFEDAIEIIRQSIKLGNLPEHLAVRLEQGLEHLVVMPGDRLFMNGTEGSYNPSTNSVKLSYESDSNIDDEVKKDIVVHEVIHQLSGGTYRQKRYDQTRTRIGFEEGLYSRKYVGINEAITEHLSISAIGGGYETISPEARNENGLKNYPVYEVYREALSEFIEQSNGQITIDMVIDAYFEDNGETPNTQARRTLTRAARGVYGAGALRKLEQLCQNPDLNTKEDFASELNKMKLAARAYEKARK